MTLRVVPPGGMPPIEESPFAENAAAALAAILLEKPRTIMFVYETDKYTKWHSVPDSPALVRGLIGVVVDAVFAETADV